MPVREESSSSDSSMEPSEPELQYGNPDNVLDPNLDRDVEMGSAPIEDEDACMHSPSLASSDDGINLEKVVDSSGNTVYVEHYPDPHTGQPIRKAMLADLPSEYQHYPDVGALNDQDNFNIAKLLMESGVSGRLRNQYLTLKRLKDRLLWKNNRVMLMDIDKLPHGPDWFVKMYNCDGSQGVKKAECWMRNSFAVIKRLLLDWFLGKKMHWVPEKHYTDQSRKNRQQGETWAGDWIWRAQVAIGDKHASVISVIVSSDEMRLTNFVGDKKAHLVYMTIGNIPKHLQRHISSRATILIGYLPVPKLDCEPNADTKRQLKCDLFHHCVEDMLALLTKVCVEGGAEVPCADGAIRHVYPVLATYITDYPEQCKVACVKQTHCPLCTTLPKTRGDPGDSGLHEQEHTLQIMKKQDRTGSAWFTRYGLLPTRPFWDSHPHVDVGTFLTPDLLHQVHKGVMKDHLIKWVTSILGKSTVDEHYTTMPEAHRLRHFKNGISSVSQWTGHELKEMVKVLLPVLSDADPRVVRVVRALMDFMYLSHASSLTNEDLKAMEDALQTFHDHKDVFQELGAITTDKGFHGIPKLHMISHYVHLICELGTPDGYNTETSERLHIDFAKMGYHMSNKINVTKQMALYIQCLEAIAMHAAHLQEQENLAKEDEDVEGEDVEDEDWWDAWYDNEEDADREEEILPKEEENQEEVAEPELEAGEEAQAGQEVGSDGQASSEGEPVYAVEWDEERDGDSERGRLCYPSPEVVVAKTPTVKQVSANHMIRHHGATNIMPSLRTYLNRVAGQYCDLDFEDVDEYWFNIWSCIRLFHPPPPFKPTEGPHTEVVQAQPEKSDTYGRVTKPARFDTVLILTNQDGRGIHCYRPARVRVIFQLPTQIRHVYPRQLAYVEMFNYCSGTPVGPTALFTTAHARQNGERLTTIVPLSAIQMTCHLALKYMSAEVDEYLPLQSDMLSIFSKFFLNIFSSYFMYELMRHWNQDGQLRYAKDDKDEDPPWVWLHLLLDEDADDPDNANDLGEDEENEEEEDEVEAGWGDNEDEDEDEEEEEEEEEAAYVPPCAPTRPQTSAGGSQGYEAFLDVSVILPLSSALPSLTMPEPVAVPDTHPPNVIHIGDSTQPASPQVICVTSPHQEGPPSLSTLVAAPISPQIIHLGSGSVPQEGPQVVHVTSPTPVVAPLP
ncbi:hypothetical protein RSAG8_05947, partial [Rhizoctonia solani AG-8 WAC10335]